MRKNYLITFDVAAAAGLLAFKYVNSNGKGLLTIDGTESDFISPNGRTFTVSGNVAKAWDVDGVRLDPQDIAKLVFGPVQYTFKSGAQTFSGSNWTATLSITMADDGKTLQAIIEGSGTGLARFAAKNIRIIVNGTLQV